MAEEEEKQEGKGFTVQDRRPVKLVKLPKSPKGSHSLVQVKPATNRKAQPRRLMNRFLKSIFRHLSSV
jgi:hypothetical protein